MRHRPTPPRTWTDPLVTLQSQTPLPVDQFVTFKVNQLSMAFERQWTRFMREKAGVSLSEWRILAMLASHGPLPFARVVEATGINKALCSRSARTLQNQKLITSAETDGDARSITLALAPRGERLVAEVRPHAQRRQSLLLSALTPAERKALYAAIDKLQQAAQSWDAAR